MEKEEKKMNKEKKTRVVEKSVLRMFWLDAVENQGPNGAGSISGTWPHSTDLSLFSLSVLFSI